MAAERYDAFVSYGHGDAEWVRALAGNLERLGLRVFLDAWELVAGDLIAVQLQRGLAAANAVVFVVSAASVGRGWVNEEFAATIASVATGGQRLIPVLAGEVALPPMVAGRLYVDFRDADDPAAYETKVRELAAAIRGRPGRDRPEPGGAVVPLPRALPALRPQAAGFVSEALPVTPPVGSLPVDVRGRDGLLAELRQALLRRRPRGSVWVLTGMGGLGKSTVALAIAETALRRGRRVWWVTATDTASLTGGMLEILAQLGAPESVTRLVQEGAPTAPDRAWEFISGARAAGKRWLLIFDDADDPAVLAAAGKMDPADGTGWLRDGLPGMIIVTTRRRDPHVWGRKVHLRELDTLDDEAAADVLGDLAPSMRDDARGSARDLGHRLGGLPLALHLAGTYLASSFRRWHSFADYLQALDNAGLASTLAALDDPRDQARATVTRTWKLSLDALADDGRPQAAGLLFLLSCYAPVTPIPVAVLQPRLLGGILLVGESANEHALEWQRRRRDAGLNGLSAVGLINVADEPGGAHDRVVTVHPIVADVNRDRLLHPARDRDVLPAISKTAVDLIQAACHDLDSRNPAHWPTWRLLILHTAALLGWLSPSMADETLAELVTTASMSSVALWRSGNPAAAERLALASLEAADGLGKDHRASLTARSQLAQAVALTRYAEAESMFRELLADQQRILGEEDNETMVSQRVLARLAGLQGRYKQAEQMYRRLLADRQRILGSQHPETLATRFGLAGMTDRVGHYAEAERMFRELLADQQRILGENHQECLEIRSGLARTIEDQRRFTEAEQLYRQLLDDDERILGPDHPGTMNTRQSLARVAAAQGRLDEARQRYQQLLTDRERILGDDHPVTRATREFLAGTIETGHLASQPGMAPVETLLSQPTHPPPPS